ncbi:MAG TPA: methyltransferase domain-containing protein [Conexibacter sp.]|nr:methyltransferase domain-containing protein [Conexibacter sp.]
MLGARKRSGGRPSADLFATDDGRRLVLHVGCGPPRAENLHDRFRGADWRELRLDIDPRMLPDIVADITGMPEVPAASVDAVWSSHNIEHVFAYQVPRVFEEFLRVLRPGGSVLVTTPDLQRAAERIASGRLDDPLYDSPAGPVTPLDMVYGHGREISRGFEEMAHRTGYTARSLERALREAGFVDVRVRREREDLALWAEARRPAGDG